MHWRHLNRNERPVSVAEAKEYLGLPEVYSTPLLETILDGAIAAVERFAGVATTRCQIEVWYDAVDGPVAIPQPPLVSVDEAALVDTATGQETELSPSDYTVTTNGRVWFFALATPATDKRLRLRCTVGYESAAAVPAELKLAILRTALRTWLDRSSAVQVDLEPLKDAELWRTWVQH